MFKNIVSSLFYIAVFLVIIVFFTNTTIDDEDIGGDKNDDYAIIGEGIIVGADGEYIVIVNNPDAANPT